MKHWLSPFCLPWREGGRNAAGRVEISSNDVDAIPVDRG